MASSYIPEDSKVVCTFMTCGVPQMLQASPERTIVHTSKGKPLLNIEDKKLSGCFQCQVKASFWMGLQSLCLGIAIAALAVMVVAATVVTGGLALATVAACVSLGACVAGAASGGIGSYQIAHACDLTLDSKSAWKFYHKSVALNQQKALLNGSVLHCVNGGVVSIIMSPQIALFAASEISTYNMNAVEAQKSSQLKIGIISGVCAATGGGAGLIATAALAIPSYWLGEEKIITKAVLGEEVAEQPYVGSALETTTSVLTEMAAPGAGLTAVGYAQYGVGVATKNLNTQFMGGVFAWAGKKEFIKAFKPSPSMGVGLLGAGLSYYIGEESDREESAWVKKADATRIKCDDVDSSNGISVISQR